MYDKLEKIFIYTASADIFWLMLLSAIMSAYGG